MGGGRVLLLRIPEEGMVGPGDRRLGVAPVFVWRKMAFYLRLEMALFGTMGKNLFGSQTDGAIQSNGIGSNGGHIREGHLEFRLHRSAELERLVLYPFPTMPTRKLSVEKAHTVTHLTTVHPPFDVRIFHKECKSIARAGFDVTLIACHNRDETVDGVRLKGIPKRSGRLSRMTRGLWTAYREARRTDSELYHFHDPELIPVGLLMRLKGKKVVYDVHEDVRADMAAKYYIPRPLRGLLTWFVSVFEAGAVRHFSAVVPATIPISLHFESRTYHTVVVSNYPLVDELHPEIRKPWAQRSSSIAYVGVLAEDRCAGEMVKAMGLLPESLKATLKLAGSFSPQNLRDELALNNGWDRTQFLGILGRVQVRELLGEVRAGLAILKPTPGFLESAPIKIFEYMSAGIPVIASNFPGFSKIIEEAGCGILVDPLDPRSVARAIEYIFYHPKEAEQMGLRGREAIKSRYNWPSEERKLLNLYRELLDSPCVA